jgi:glutathione S-transferase
MIKLYDFELSACCYTVRLMLSVLRVPFERIELDVYPGREHESEWFRAVNPSGELPVIDDGGVLLRKVPAILEHLTATYDPSGRWHPRHDPGTQKNMARWLEVAERLTATAGAARLHDTMFYEADIEACRAGAHTLFRALDEHLWFAEQSGHEWLCTESHPTMADIACFPPVMLSEEGGVSRLPYPAIRRWTDRVKRIPNFTTMSGIFNAAPPRSSPVGSAPTSDRRTSS